MSVPSTRRYRGKVVPILGTSIPAPVVKLEKKERKELNKISKVLDQVGPPSKIVRKGPPGVNRVKKLGYTRITPAGRAWLKLYLNPMGKDDPAIIGYPDGSATRSVLGDYRQDFNLTLPKASNITYSNGGGDMSEANYNASVGAWETVTILVLALPTVEHVALVRIYPTSPVTVVPVDSTVAAIPVFPAWRVWASDGSIVNTPSEVGFVQTLIRLDNVGAHCNAAVSYRMIARGTTSVYTCPQLENQGFVTSAQFNAEPALAFMYQNFIDSATLTTDTPPVLNTTTASALTDPVWQFEPNNIAPSALVECYHNAYTSRCVDGCYSPVYSSSRDNPYRSSLSRPVTVSSANNSIAYNDRVLPGWNTSVTWFEGVTPKFSIKMKHRSVFQFIAASGNILANFTRQEPTDDDVALQGSWHMRNTMAHAYPASYNDWGWLGDLVDAGISLIPGIGTAYKFAKPLLKPAWNWLGGKVRNYFGNPVVSDGDVFYDAE